MKPDFKPMERSSLADGLAERIARTIQSGAYESGDRLPAMTEMAQKFGVGYPTLREALKQLETVGVIEIKHGSGVYVRESRDVMVVSNPVFGGVVSKKLMIDLIEARTSIETLSAALAAEHAGEEQLERMAAHLEEAGKHLDDDGVLNTNNMAFHREIAKASNNVVLAQLLDVLADLFKSEQRVIIDIYSSRRKDHEEHLGILEALRARDSRQAEERMRRHLDGVREAIEHWNPEETPLS